MSYTLVEHQIEKSLGLWFKTCLVTLSFISLHAGDELATSQFIQTQNLSSFLSIHKHNSCTSKKHDTPKITDSNSTYTRGSVESNPARFK